MWTLQERLPSDGCVDDEVVLPFDRRQHSRLRVSLVSGREAALLLPRGTMLSHGDRLGGTDTAGKPVAIRVVAAAEEVYVVRGEPLMRAAYHLGNRHVPLELAEDHLRLERDPVLREMLVGLGFSVTDEVLPFEPEPGAYGQGRGHGHDAGHGHGHDVGHGHGHDAGHGHGHDAGHGHGHGAGHGHGHGAGHGHGHGADHGHGHDAGYGHGHDAGHDAGHAPSHGRPASCPADAVTHVPK